MPWVQVALWTLAAWVLAVLLLVLLSRRLPDGLLKDLAAFAPACVAACRTLRRDPGVPRRAKLAIGFALLWVLSPVDLVPEFLPVIGLLDDLLVVTLALRWAGRQVPRETVLAAWPGETRLIERLLGPSTAGEAAPGSRVRPLLWRVPGTALPPQEHGPC